MPARKLITEDQEQEMVAQYEGGSSIYVIGAAHGYAPQTVHKVLQRRKVVTRTRGGRYNRPITAEERLMITTRYRTGESAAVIARDLKRPVAGVFRVLQQESVPVRQRGGREREFTDDDFKVMRELHDQGVRPDGIAQRLASSGESIRRALRGIGIEPHYGIGTGPHSPGWKGGRVRWAGGYVAVWVAKDDPLRVMARDDGYIAEHRLVMAHAIGRPLQKYETVHHLNGVRDDNRLENLQLRTGNHGKGVVMRCLDCGSHNVDAAKLGDPVDFP